MARQETHQGDIVDRKAPILEYSAAQLSRRYSIDTERIRRVLECTAIALEPDEWPKDPDVGLLTLRQLFRPWIGDALECLEPERAIRLFEESDLEDLQFRVSFTRCLDDRNLPLHSLEELADVAESCIAHLERNKEVLLRDGFPSEVFRDSYLLHLRLNRLYYLKLPWRPERVEIKTDHPMQILREMIKRDPDIGPDDPLQRFVTESTWTKLTVPAGMSSGEGEFWWKSLFHKVPASSGSGPEGGKSVKRILDRDGVSIEGIKPQDEKRLVAGRRKMFDIKQEILSKLVVIVHKATPERLWDECTGVIQANMDRNEVDFYLRMDRLYTRMDVRTGVKLSAGHSFRPGGLTDLLLMIGHYEKEMRMETFATTRAVLGDLLKDGRTDLPPDQAGNYFKLLDCIEGSTLNNAIDQLLLLVPLERPFWKEYRGRIRLLLSDLMLKKTVSSQLQREVDAAGGAVLPELPYPSFIVSKRRRLDDSVVPIPVPPNTRWEDVKIELLNAEEARIRVGAETWHRTYKQLGFGNRRKHNQPPDRMWTVLQALAKLEGELTVADAKKLLGEDWSLLKKWISNIRSRLRAVCPVIQGDPFEPYWLKGRKNMYKARFTLQMAYDPGFGHGDASPDDPRFC